MAQTKVLRVIPNTSNRATFLQFFLILVLLFSISIISFSQAFSAYLPGVCVALFNPPHSCCCQQIRKNIFFFRTILYYLEPFCPREMVQVTNTRTIRFKGPNSLVELAMSQKNYHSQSWVVLSAIEINHLQFCELKLQELDLNWAYSTFYPCRQ